MKLSRIRGPFPWLIATILALVPCLPLLTFLAWFKWELPPLQRCYLEVYWHSFEGAKQPGTQTQMKWLLETAPGRKSRWLISSDATEGKQNGLPLKLSSEALDQGWTGIETSPAQSIDSAELEGILREYFYGGRSLRQLANEPLLYGGATWLIVVYLLFMMREEIGDEFRRLRRAVAEPEWAWDSGGNSSANQEGILTRIRSGITRCNSKAKVLFNWVDFTAAISRRSNVNQTLKAESLYVDDRPVSTDVPHERSNLQQLANPFSSHSPKALSQGHTIFPGSSTSDVAHVQPKSWDESEWLD